MSEMQERVTDAIMGAFEHIPDKEYRRTIAGCWARAVLEVMREPTEKMKLAGDEVLPDHAGFDDDASGAYRAMISAELN